MKNLLPLILLVFLAGCASYKIFYAHGAVNGTNLNTPYGPATGTISYDSFTCLGHCPEPKEIINADFRPTSNTAK